MIARLDEFSKRELQAVLDAIILKMAFMKLESAQKTWSHEKQTEFDDLMTFRIQLLNAIGKVGLQEEIASN